MTQYREQIALEQDAIKNAANFHVALWHCWFDDMQSIQTVETCVELIIPNNSRLKHAEWKKIKG